MPSKYDEVTKAKAVRLVVEHRDDYDSEWAAITAVASRLADSPYSLLRSSGTLYRQAPGTVRLPARSLLSDLIGSNGVPRRRHRP
ncbi:hypothetical protein [Nocardia noduli]|uniref:hypothetical protein n=1 Tax=Nocardia noduli TaxID=2815722 RepID=UPI001C24A509|nr:hypothetical protein [Nocardia noduli]